jgi:hypothetical protein
MRKTCKRTRVLSASARLLRQTDPKCVDNHPPQSSKEAGLDRALLLRNSTLTSCSCSIARHYWLAFGDIPSSSFATGRDSRAYFSHAGKIGPDRRPSRKCFRGEKKQPALTGSLGNNPDVRGRRDFWAGTHSAWS